MHDSAAERLRSNAHHAVNSFVFLDETNDATADFIMTFFYEKGQNCIRALLKTPILQIILFMYPVSYCSVNTLERMKDNCSSDSVRDKTRLCLKQHQLMLKAAGNLNL